MENLETIESKLESANFTFSQDGNYDDPEDIEILEIKCQSSCGIDNDRDCYYVLKTEKWSINSLDDLKNLFERISKSLKK